ncbi:MAG: helix-turn-helix domain-containing protein [Actinomycetota bacterium]|nr:helix-turn-helix domain-containing protein [Actinomycetota bacterium]
MLDLDHERCYQTLLGRDPRFDGWFVTAVRTTGIYCRPSCPARTPRREVVEFFPTPAAAQHRGYRACLRCRPDAVPGSPAWLGRAEVAARAMRMIQDGVVDRDGVAGLARQLGYSERQLHRVLLAALGTGAAALARAQRAQTARILLETTPLSVGDAAFAAGFSSVRQFNETIQAVFGRTPTALRALARRGPANDAARPPAISVRLAARAPLAVGTLSDFLAARAVPGLEAREGEWYRRSLVLPRGEAVVEIAPGPGHARAVFHLGDLRDLTAAIARVRHLYNLDADPVAIDARLAADPALAASVAAAPGLRVPGAADGFELAVRAVLGQQVSLTHARRLLAHVLRAGATLTRPLGTVTACFPTPLELLAQLDDDPPAMPASRVRTLRAVGEAVASGALDLGPGASPARLCRQAEAIFGLGPWSAHYLAMRVGADPDAFLASDVAARRGASALGLDARPAALAERAERWRPWRAHALVHLWLAASRSPQRRPITTKEPADAAIVPSR